MGDSGTRYWEAEIRRFALEEIKRHKAFLEIIEEDIRKYEIKVALENYADQ